jgi:hypothetical protein
VPTAEKKTTLLGELDSLIMVIAAQNIILCYLCVSQAKMFPVQKAEAGRIE